MRTLSSVVVRPLTPRDDEAVIGIFEATLLLGHRTATPLALFDRYADLCLGWYLGPGRNDAAVASIDDQIVGYALVCADSVGQAKWVRRRTPKLMTAVSRRLVTGSLDPFSRRFYAGRARDARTLWRSGSAPPYPVHAHLNVLPHGRTGTVALLLRDHIDERTRQSHSPGWWAEMNAIDGRRERALERLGLQVTHRQRSETMSSLLERDVVRLTIHRPLPTSD
jgi:hypothetical protein